MSDPVKTPNCCANCIQCTRFPTQTTGVYLGGEKYNCRKFKKVVEPFDESCKVHERYYPAKEKTWGKEIEMEKHQARVVAEKEELDGRIERLRAFIAGDKFDGSGTFDGLSTAEQRRLRRQEAIMGLYSDVLDERIIAFS